MVYVDDLIASVKTEVNNSSLNIPCSRFSNCSYNFTIYCCQQYCIFLMNATMWHHWGINLWRHHYYANDPSKRCAVCIWQPTQIGCNLFAGYHLQRCKFYFALIQCPRSMSRIKSYTSLTSVQCPVGGTYFPLAWYERLGERARKAIKHQQQAAIIWCHYSSNSH